MYSTAMYVGNHRILLDQLFCTITQENRYIGNTSNFHNNIVNYIITHFIELSLYVVICLYSTLYVPTWLYVISTT